jgi:hypothetical protein
VDPLKTGSTPLIVILFEHTQHKLAAGGVAANGLCQHHLLTPLFPNAVRHVLKQLHATGAASLRIWYDPQGQHRESVRPPSHNGPTDCGVASHCAASAALPLGRPCHLTRHLHLPPPVCLLFAPAGCCISSHCPTFATHPVDVQLPHMCQLAVAMLLVTLPLQLILSACYCLLTHHHHLPLPFASCLPWLVVASLLIALPLPLILLLHCRLSKHQQVEALSLTALPLQLILLTCRHLSTSRLVVALPLIALPLLLILSARPCLSTHRLYLLFPICLSFAPAGCHVTGIGIGADCKQYPFYWGKDRNDSLQMIQDCDDITIPFLSTHHLQTHVLHKLIYLCKWIGRIARI